MFCSARLRSWNGLPGCLSSEDPPAKGKHPLEMDERRKKIGEAVERAFTRDRTGRSSRKNLLLIVGVLIAAFALREAGLFGETHQGVTLPEAGVADVAAMLSGAPLMTHLGNPDGETVIIVFSDYSCGHCRRMAPVIDDFLASNPDMRVAVIEFPILGEDSVRAARHALAAGLQDAWPAYHRALMFSTVPLADSGFSEIGANLGLDPVRLTEDAQADAVSDALVYNRQIASAAGVDGTPSFIIGGHLFVGSIDSASLGELVSTLHSR